MARVPEWPDPWDPDIYRPTPAAPAWPEATIVDKDPTPVLLGPKGQPLPPTNPPHRFGFQPHREPRSRRPRET